MFLEGIAIIISLLVSIRSTLLQVMTRILLQNDIIIIILIYNIWVDTQNVGGKWKNEVKAEVQTKVGFKKKQRWPMCNKMELKLNMILKSESCKLRLKRMFFPDRK